MKLFSIIFLFGLSFNIFAQGNSSESSINYIKINNFSSPTINIASINDFIKLMDDNKITSVFYTDKLFLIQTSSLMYTIDTNGYKNIEDCKNGNDKGFSNGNSYYFAVENNLPNQNEVDFYRQEGFLTNVDYQDATRSGFTHSNITERKIYGLITENDLQRNLRYLNIIAYLMQYRNWQFFEDQDARQNPTPVNSYSYRDTTLQQQESARLQRERRDQEGLLLLDNTSIETIISKFDNGQIRKLGNFNYYLINIPLTTYSLEKDSIFYYACKFCQYSNVTEYKNNNTGFSLKDTDQIIKRLSFDTLENFLDADVAKIPNGNDYNLMFAYYITLEQLNQNRTFILELERIKQRYLSSIDLTAFRGSIRDKRSFRASEMGRAYNRKANITEIFAFTIYNLLKQQKSIPVTYTSFINKVQEEYRNNSIYSYISFDQGTIRSVFTQVPQIGNLFVVSNDSFYMK